MNLKQTIEERIANAYAAGYNDAHHGRDRIHEVVDRESAAILAAVHRRSDRDTRSILEVSIAGWDKPFHQSPKFSQEAHDE